MKVRQLIDQNTEKIAEMKLINETKRREIKKYKMQSSIKTALLTKMRDQ